VFDMQASLASPVPVRRTPWQRNVTSRDDSCARAGHAGVPFVAVERSRRRHRRCSAPVDEVTAPCSGRPIDRARRGATFTV
jgi:hypothetical protein